MELEGTILGMMDGTSEVAGGTTGVGAIVVGDIVVGGTVTTPPAGVMVVVGGTVVMDGTGVTPMGVAVGGVVTVTGTGGTVVGLGVVGTSTGTGTGTSTGTGTGTATGVGVGGMVDGTAGEYVPPPNVGGNKLPKSGDRVGASCPSTITTTAIGAVTTMNTTTTIERIVVDIILLVFCLLACGWVILMFRFLLLSNSVLLSICNKSHHCTSILIGHVKRMGGCIKPHKQTHTHSNQYRYINKYERL